jgi:hypothetical protein
MRIIVHEYPKSGGSWVVGLLGDALGIDKRDVYVGDGYDAFDVRKHPWYRGASSLGLTDRCVIKSHERPGSPLLAFPARQVHLVRDGRDVVVSKFFFERDFCVKNGIYEGFDEPFGSYVPRVAREWAEYVGAWLAEPGVVSCRYEDFLARPGDALERLLAALDCRADSDAVAAAVSANTRDRLRSALAPAFSHNTFVRKGVAGDWRNHFADADEAAFSREAGEVLRRVGYGEAPAPAEAQE